MNHPKLIITCQSHQSDEFKYIIPQILGVETSEMTFPSAVFTEVAFLYHCLNNPSLQVPASQVTGSIVRVMAIMEKIPTSVRCKEYFFLQKILLLVIKNMKEILDIFLQNEGCLNEISLDSIQEESDSVDGSERENGSSRRSSRSKRANYPKSVTTILRNWLGRNLANPYPSEEAKKRLGEDTGLDFTQINNWFINARRRVLPAWIAEKGNQQ